MTKAQHLLGGNQCANRRKTQVELDAAASASLDRGARPLRGTQPHRRRVIGPNEIRLWREAPSRRRINRETQMSTHMRASEQPSSVEMDMAIVTHDLRVPLQVVVLGLEILRRHPLGSAESELVQRIYGATKRMGSLIDRVLDYASLQRGPSVLHRQPVDLERLCRETVEELRIAYPGKEFRVLAERAVSGSWDRLRLVELVSNLLVNAIKHGDASAPVVIEVRRKGGVAQLAVANRGPAIPPELMHIIFEPFYRGPSAAVHRGAGLGLYIAARIVAAHGGTIAVSSGRKRTRFTVTLPLDTQ